MAPRAQDVERLKSIKRFDQLVKYLRDELGWPIENDNFEDIFFDWDAHELGIDPASAAKIEEIKQLRPLSPGQPWGIFFVKFEPKKIPVVALRRILSKLVIRKRAQRGDQAAWKEHDLLFISNYGEGDDRQITFAQFSQPTDQDLPTLKVLGWDDSDTALHIDYTHHTLKDKLTWRNEYKKDFKTWREAWAGAFVLRNREVIETSQELAIQLADLAKRIRKRALKVLQIEKEDGVLRQLYAAFQKNLIHDLDQKGFADMYAQTITYGLLAARMSRQGNLVSDHISDMVPVTNPFLKELLETFLNVGGRQEKIDFDELGIQDVVELLNRPETKIDAILRDFGNRTRQEDPVVHFYESFLREYDPALKVQRGVFYTPQPVVSYIVRSVHELLQTEFGLEDGLASTITWGEMEKRHSGLKMPESVNKDSMFVQILDPATGTGTFLVEVIDVIHKHLTKKWIDDGHGEKKRLDLWNNYVPRYLLTRLYGYELMMAPYTVAHMKIGLKLVETNYRFGVGERLRVYLTNTLAPATDDKYIEKEWFYALAHEAQAVNAIKRNERFTIVIGNPPYSANSFNQSRNEMGELTFIGNLIEDYKQIDGVTLGEQNPKLLHDDYVKFIRYGQYLLERSGEGILGFITNHGFKTNPTFRGMRKNLMVNFQNIYINDLHGNSRKKESSPTGEKDENVFDIQQGVAILFCAKHYMAKSNVKICHFDLWGERKKKYSELTNMDVLSTRWSILQPMADDFLFAIQDALLNEEYKLGWSLAAIFNVFSTGVKTHRDHFAIDFHLLSLKKRLQEFRDLHISDTKISKNYFLSDTRDWKLAQKRRSLARNSDWEKHLTEIVYRPFDIRHYYHHPDIVELTRDDVMSHMQTLNNVGLVASRVNRKVSTGYFLVSRKIIDCHVLDNAGDSISLFPLYLEFSDLFSNSESKSDKNRSLNLTRAFIAALASKFSLPQAEPYQLPKGCLPEDILYYSYAIFHSPGYRSRYSEFLNNDFPRLPLTGNFELFSSLSQLGGFLVSLHLMESPKLNKRMTKYVGGSNPEIEKITYSDETVWIDKNQSVGFKGVPENVWDFHIGGYQVCEKWLKDRKDRKLSKDDIEHYQKIVVALSETIRLMAEIDKLIESHGGWPGAFAVKHKASK